MPPARRPLTALGSLQLVGYANNPTRVITELAFIADAQANVPRESGQSDVNAPLEVQFEEFMDGINSRGKGTKTRQRKMTVEQAAAVLLVTVQKGHVELIAKKNDPQTIDVIKVLPEAKRIVAAFLPKLRGYGDIPYDQRYRGAIALAKRHFFPSGKSLTKKELMALLLQSYQEKKELNLKCRSQPQSTKTLGIQTSSETIDGSSCPGTTNADSAPCVRPAACTNTVETGLPSSPQSVVELPSSNFATENESASVASETNANPENDDDVDLVTEGEAEPMQLVAFTPVVPRSLNPYMTPVSNPRYADHIAATRSSPNASPILALGNRTEIVLNEGNTTDEDVGELLQATATSQGRLNHYYNKFIAACQKITFLEGQKEDIQREFHLTKKKLDETEERLREANADRSNLKKWVDKLRRQVDSIYKQLGLLRGMADLEAMDSEYWFAHNSESQGGFDPNST